MSDDEEQEEQMNMNSTYDDPKTRDKGPGPSMAEIAALKNKGMNNAQIARIYGVTRQAISLKWLYYGGYKTKRQEVLAHFPFQVPAQLQQTAPYRNLRDHGEYMATRGKGMRAESLRRLHSFWKKLKEEDLVVEYDPEIPPIEGVSNKGGWAYRQREDGDDDLIIRVNEYTDLTELGKQLWRLPPEE